MLRDRLGNGWLQVEDTKEPGVRIQSGFSGGPVEDLESDDIVGMVVAATTDRAAKIGFVIPAEAIVHACRDLFFAEELHTITDDPDTQTTSEEIPAPVSEEQPDMNHAHSVIEADFSDFVVKVSNVENIGPIGVLRKPLDLDNISESKDAFSVAFSPNGHLLASGGSEQKVELWSMDLKKHWRTLQVPKLEGDVHSVTFSPRADLLASCAVREFSGFITDSTVRLWRLDNGTNLDELGEPGDQRRAGNVTSVAFSPREDLLATGSTNEGLLLWKVEGGKLVLIRRLYVRTPHHATSVAFSQEGKRVASGTHDAYIRVWGVDGSWIRTLQGHKGIVSSVAFSPKGQVLASASKDEKIVRLWDLRDGSALRELRGHEGTVSSFAFSPDGEMLITVSSDETVRLWRVEDGSLLRVLEEHERAIRSVAFSPKGWEIASVGAYEWQVRLWGLLM